MTAPSDPLVTPDELAVYLNDPSINIVRAQAIIADAQILCESIVSPLPAAAAVVVKRVALAAYVSMTSSRQKQLIEAGAGFGTGGSVTLTDQDEIDLRRLAGGSSGAFSIDLLPEGFTVVAPPWDTNGWGFGGWGYNGWGGW